MHKCRGRQDAGSDSGNPQEIDAAKPLLFTLSALGTLTPALSRRERE
jgi:hypothetical protein